MDASHRGCNCSPNAKTNFTWHVARASLGGLVLLAAACSGSTDGTGSTSGSSNTDSALAKLSLACTNFYDAAAIHAVHCKGGNSVEFDLGDKSTFVQWCSAKGKAPGAPMAEYAAGFALCAHAFAGLSCFDDVYQGACRNALTGLHGTLDQGAHCADPNQCASGVCSMQSSDACGMCDAAAATGSECVITAAGQQTFLPCARGAVCDTAASKRCIAKTVVAIGVACDNLGAVCDVAAECVVATGATAGTCAAFAKKGEACEAPLGKARCESAYNCVAGVCVDLAVQGAACAPTAHCTTTGKITNCTGAVACGLGLLCDSVSQRCIVHALAGKDESCAVLTCDAGLYCASSKTCAPVAALGDRCERAGVSAPECGRNAVCLEGKCAIDDPALCK